MSSALSTYIPATISGRISCKSSCPESREFLEVFGPRDPRSCGECLLLQLHSLLPKAQYFAAIALGRKKQKNESFF
jgi:hypothetical protein